MEDTLRQPLETTLAHPRAAGQGGQAHRLGVARLKMLDRTSEGAIGAASLVGAMQIAGQAGHAHDATVAGA